MTEETKLLLSQIRTLKKSGLSNRAVAAKLGITAGRVHGILYRHG